MSSESSRYEHSYLVEALSAGDEAAFTAIYEIYSKPLLRKIMLMVKDEDIAKEILQDLFLKIWLNRERIDPLRSFKAYIQVVASNMVYDHFRAAAKSRELSARLLQLSVDYYTHTEERLIHKDNLSLIRGAIDLLSPQRKKIFIMCKIDGKSYEEVSRELSISTSTIRDHMVKANRVVKDYLHNHPDMALLFLMSGLIS